MSTRSYLLLIADDKNDVLIVRLLNFLNFYTEWNIIKNKLIII